MSIDAEALVVEDLRALRRGRARHFVPALVLSLLTVGGFLVVGGLRPDLWLQPPVQLVAQLAVWLLCLVALPAVGLGLWFPPRPLRVVLASAAVLAAVLAALGPGLFAMLPGTGQGPQMDPCVAGTFGSGLGLLAIGVLSGAFAARRWPGSAIWVSGGVALMALDAVVWHCPSEDMHHNLFSHLGAALLLLLLASVVAVIVHRRQRPAPV